MTLRSTPLNTARLVLAAAVPVLGAAPLLFADTQLVLLTEFFSMLVLAIMWNVLAGYADIVTVGSTGSSGSALMLFTASPFLRGSIRTCHCCSLVWSR
jgi:branched-chain amino acid transport system permease protein